MKKFARDREYVLFTTVFGHFYILNLSFCGFTFKNIPNSDAAKYSSNCILGQPVKSGNLLDTVYAYTAKLK